MNISKNMSKRGLVERVSGFKWNNLNISAKLISMMALTSIIPLIILGSLSVDNSSDEITRAIYRGNELYADLTGNRINEYFHAREGDAKILAESKISRDGIEKLNSFKVTKDEELNIYKDFERLYSVPLEAYGYTDIFVTNKYGEIVYSLNYEKLDLAPLVFSNDFVNIAMTGDQNWSEVFRNSFINDNIMVLSTPILSYKESDNLIPIGTLNIVLNQAAISTIVQTDIDTYIKNGYSNQISSNGYLLTDTLKEPYNHDSALKESIETDAVKWLSEPINNQEIRFKATKDYTNYQEYQVIGTLSVTKLGDTFAGLVIEADKKQAMFSVDRLRKLLIVITTIILFVSFAIALAVSTTISRPIKKLTGLISRISEYDLNIGLENSTELKRKDEVGDLSRAITAISDNLKNILTEVDNSTQRLVESSAHLNSVSKEVTLAA